MARLLALGANVPAAWKALGCDIATALVLAAAIVAAWGSSGSLAVLALLALFALVFVIDAILRRHGGDGETSSAHRLRADQAVLPAAQVDLDAFLRLAPGFIYRMTARAGAVPAGAGSFRRWFPGGCDLLGLPAANAGNELALDEHVFPADRPLLADAIARCLSTGHATVEYRLRGPARDLHWIRDRMRLAGGSRAETIVFGYMVEITREREEMGRLCQVERLAALGEVAAGLAHELNQPLAVIAMAAENGLRLLCGEADKSRIEAKLTLINDQVHRLSRITDAVSLASRADGESPRMASFGDVVEHVRRLVEPRLLAAGVRLDVEAAPGLPLIEASSLALEQTLMSLIVNACEAYDVRAAAAAERSIRLVARVEADQVRITVADQGGGIPAGAIDRVFDPFFTTKPPGKGAGLGLSVSYARMAEMGGRLSVHNGDGGAVFDILLPVLPSSRTADTVP